MTNHVPEFRRALVTEIGHRVIFADSRSMMELADESVHLIVTSPPYWQLKDYGHGGQIGFGESFETYIDSLNAVWSECHRVLYEGCRLCVNIGDLFIRSTRSERYRVIPINVEIVRFCLTAGFDYMGSIIWQKVTTTNSSGGASVMGSYPFPRNGIVRKDYEHILLFKKPGLGPIPTTIQKEASRMTGQEWSTYFSGHWNIQGVRQQGHVAMFPEEVPKRLIKMFSFVGETVLDPFLGSGTTSLAARNSGRNSIGYEVNPEFRPIIERKVGFQGYVIHDGEGRLQFEERAADPDAP
ncbi:MAG: site-specific DNA-methyltransferase [bacterium]|nr:site-specific DNA-methyltransferase [bacterium]